MCPVDTPEATPTTLELRVAQTNELALDLYGQLSASDGNLIVAPHSIVTAFGMAYAGARGATEREMAEVLHFEYPPVNFHSGLHRLNDLLESRGTTVGPESFRLAIANAAWGRQGFPYLPAFLDTLEVCYEAAIEYVDFASQPEVARLMINQWVFEQTYGLVKEIIPAGKIDPLTCLVLVNAIYFRAGWLHKFDPYYTRPRAFTRLDASTVEVPVMSGEERFPFGRGEGYKAIAFPYEGEECAMIVLLPDPGRFNTFETALSPARVDSIVASLRTGYVRVDFPKFSFQSEYELKPTLVAMGMKGAFQPGADFSGIDGTEDGVPWISFVAHEKFISVDEWGTLAAAGTGIGFTPGEPLEFDAVRPFIFLIRDNATGTILFLGRVLDPSQWVSPWL